jgi:hypothetical protein
MPPKKQHALASRVKRIMQADEDVGKIAQATPILIGERRASGASEREKGEGGAPERARVACEPNQAKSSTHSPSL